MAEADRIVLTSVGVDIGSSTSHLLFSRLELERQDGRYVTVNREVLYQSDILLTPYADATTIDGSSLGAFIDRQYQAAGLARDQVDTGALILTGVALLRDNARAIGELFAGEAGRFVSVSAGDNLEATMAAHGSGAVALSETRGAVMNVDIGGGTTKVVICRDGRTAELMAINVGARLLAFDSEGALTRLEPAGREIGARLGLNLTLNCFIAPEDLRRIATYMVDHLIAEIRVDGSTGARSNIGASTDIGSRSNIGASTDIGSRGNSGASSGIGSRGDMGTGTGGSHLLRTGSLRDRSGIAAITISGGVSEFVYDRAGRTFGDLGPLLASELRNRAAELGAPIIETLGGIRATVIGASQYTIQVSGSTIYLSPLNTVPVRNIPVVMPRFLWRSQNLEAESVSTVIQDALRHFDLLDAAVPVALAARWEGSATYARIKAFCAGAVQAMQSHLANGHPLILVFDSDIGGLLGLHVREEMHLEFPIISIDGVELREFDYIDIGALIPSSGAVPVVIKSLIFPPVP
jgi:ethanolamine utilization protein EutA